MRHVCVDLPASASQILTVWSALAVVKLLESFAHETPKMLPVCSPSPTCPRASPVLPSYSHMRLSAPTLTSVLPSGLKAVP